MAKMTTPAIHLQKVSFSFGTQKILENINLNLKANEVVAIVGVSGSGKSTLLKIINSLLPSTGTVQVEGKVRMVFQDDYLFPWYRVVENIAIAFVEAGASQKERIHKAEQMLAEINLIHLKKRFPQEISGGERQRVAILRAFASSPDIVLMDEPFQNLDVITKENMQEWLLDFWRRHSASILYVTHDVEEALLLSDRVEVLKNGRLIPVRDVAFQHPRKRSLKYSSSFLEARKKIQKILEENDEA